MITRPKLVEQLRDYQIQSHHNYSALPSPLSPYSFNTLEFYSMMLELELIQPQNPQVKDCLENTHSAALMVVGDRWSLYGLVKSLGLFVQILFHRITTLHVPICNVKVPFLTYPSGNKSRIHTRPSIFLLIQRLVLRGPPIDGVHLFS